MPLSPRQVFLPLTIALAALPVVAQTTFVSTQSGTWNNAATWGGTGVPSSADSAVVRTGHTVSVTPGSTVGGLFVEAGAVLQSEHWVNSDLTVSRALTNRGEVAPGCPDWRCYWIDVRLLGDLTNDGAWRAGATRFQGEGVQHVAATEPLDGGPVEIENAGSGVVRAAGDVTVRSGVVNLRGGRVEMGPHVLRVSGTNGNTPGLLGGWEGSGAPPAGTARGTLAFDGGTLAVHDGRQIHHLRVEGPVTLDSHRPDGTASGLELGYDNVFAGEVTVAPDALVFGLWATRVPFRVEGDLILRGRIDRACEDWRCTSPFVTVSGDFELHAGATALPWPGDDPSQKALAIGGALRTRSAPDSTGRRATRPELVGLGQLVVHGLDLDGLRLDGTWLRSEGGALTQVDDVLWTNVPTDQIQLDIRHPGVPGLRLWAGDGQSASRLPLRGLTFVPLHDREGGEGSHDAGRYVYAEDTAPDDGADLALEVAESSASGGDVEWVDVYGDPPTNHYGSFIGGPALWVDAEEALLAKTAAEYSRGTPGEADYLALRALDVRNDGSMTIRYLPNGRPQARLCPLGPSGPCHLIEVQNGAFEIVAERGLEAAGLPAFSLTGAIPAGTRPAFVAVDPTGKVTVTGGNVIAAGGGNVIAAGGGNVIAAGGGNLIGQAGSNVIAAGGGNVIAAGGGNVIAAGAGNLIGQAGSNVRPAGVSAHRAIAAPPASEATTLFVAFVPEVRLDAKIRLDGARSDAPEAAMRTDLQAAGLLPVLQPYVGAAFAGHPAALPDSTVLLPTFLADSLTVVDWVVVELRDGGQGAWRRSALLRADGQVVDFDSSTVAFRGLSPGDYTVAVYHRTHATAVSAAPVTFATGAPGVVDFTAPGTAAPGSQREVAPGQFVQVSGDVDANGAVTAADLAAFAALHGRPGYSQGDLALDGGATARDVHVGLFPALASRPDDAPAPGILDTRLRYTTDPDAGTTTAAIELRGAGTLGTSTFRLRYDPAAVRPLGGRALAFVGGHGGSTYAYDPAGAVAPPDLAGGRASVTARITLLAGPGAALPADYAELARVAFEVVDPAADPAFGWDLVEAYDGAGGAAGAFGVGAREVVDGGLAVAGGGPPVGGPAALALGAPYPNPGRGQTSVRYSVPAAGPVRLAVHDALGREVAVLVEGDRAAGDHVAALDAGALAPGAYVVRLVAGAGALSTRLTVVR